MKFSETFIGRAASENGEPSSKRTAGFVILFFALLMEFLTLALGAIVEDFEGIDIYTFDSLLVAALTALGISAAQTMRKPKP